MNEKSGMDDAQFKKYLLGSIIVIYPNVRSVKGNESSSRLIADWGG